MPCSVRKFTASALIFNSAKSALRVAAVISSLSVTVTEAISTSTLLDCADHSVVPVAVYVAVSLLTINDSDVNDNSVTA